MTIIYWRKQMEIREILTEESIILDLKSTTKEDIIQELVDKLYDTGSITLKSKFIKALKRREKIGSTSIGIKWPCHMEKQNM
ncbi:phosphoenolpyruvate-dependent sugar phosphotransferase system, EIIA 2 family protein [Clostridioides difficile DA00065]|nr:phosphoenolpyruvate-dependent sugar phosphotransferase system, EIIA 2 family protein [Clostridioides difficile DA00065]